MGDRWAVSVQNPEALSDTLDEVLPVHIGKFGDVFENIAILHPRRNHVWVGTFIEACTPEREEVFALVECP